MASYELEHCHLFLPFLLTVILSLSLPFQVSSLLLSASDFILSDRLPHQARTTAEGRSRLVFIRPSNREVYMSDYSLEK